MKTPTPFANENIERFTVRAHRELMSAGVADPEVRNQAVWDSWDKSRGRTIAEKRADQKLRQVAGMSKAGKRVCEFAEHSTINSKGEPVTFGVGDLVEITRYHNKRASNSAAFAAISAGHTDPADHSHKGDPPVLGATGGARIGMLGYEEPIFGIFAEEYAYSPTDLKSLPRRSVELITIPDTGERFLDPIAALGSRAPRLPMPMQYSAQGIEAAGTFTERYDAKSGRDIELYMVEAPGPMMCPGQSNTYSPGDSKRKKPTVERYDGEHEPETGETPMQNDMVSELIEAISNMPQIRFVDELMESQNKQLESAEDQLNPDPISNTPPMGGESMDPMGGAAPGELPDDEPDQYMVGEASGDPVNTPPTEDVMLEEQKDQYSADQLITADTDLNSLATVERYTADQFDSVEQYAAALQSDRKAIISDNMKLARTVQKMQRQAVDAQRSNQLGELCRNHPCFDFQEECQRVLYSAGANLTDKQFQTEIHRMQGIGERYSAAAVSNVRIPGGELPYRTDTSSASIDRNSAIQSAIREIGIEGSTKGEHYSWDAINKMAVERVDGKNTVTNAVA